MFFSALGPVDVNWFDSISVSEFHQEKSDHAEKCQESESSQSQSQSLLKRSVEKDSGHLTLVSTQVLSLFYTFLPSRPSSSDCMQAA